MDAAALLERSAARRTPDVLGNLRRMPLTGRDERDLGAGRDLVAEDFRIRRRGAYGAGCGAGAPERFLDSGVQVRHVRADEVLNFGQRVAGEGGLQGVPKLGLRFLVVGHVLDEPLHWGWRLARAMHAMT